LCGGSFRSAWTVRFVICLSGIAAAAIIFLVTDFTWLPAALSIAVAVLSFAIAELVFRRRADPETVRGDLEQRSRERML
jgi:type IV secretory pathway TrbD component